MVQLIFLAVLMGLTSICRAADITGKLQSSDGSTNMAIKDSSGVDIATVNSDGDATFNSMTQSGLGGNLIVNRASLQTGATFYVSSGTVAGQASVNSIKYPGATTATSAMPLRHVKVGHWGLSNLAASQTNLQMTFDVAGVAQNAGGSRITMPMAGVVVGICATGSVPRNTGTATFQVFKNASDVGSASDAVIDGTNTQFVCSNTGSATFVAGDILDIRVTTDATFAPAASTEYTADLFVNFTN